MNFRKIAILKNPVVPSGQIGSAWWIKPPACLDHGLHLLKLRSFPPNHAPKMRERHQLFFGLPFVSKEFQHPAIQTEIDQHFCGFFHQIKVCQPIGRQDSMQTVIQTSRRLDFIFAWSGSELWSLFEYSRVKFKNQKPIAVDILFKAYPMVPLSCGQTVPLTLIVKTKLQQSSTRMMTEHLPSCP